MEARDLVVTPAGLRFMGQHFACTVGRGGVTGAKREGDGWIVFNNKDRGCHAPMLHP